jgi:hypothetical protein
MIEPVSIRGFLASSSSAATRSTCFSALSVRFARLDGQQSHPVDRLRSALEVQQAVKGSLVGGWRCQSDSYTSCFRASVRSGASC